MTWKLTPQRRERAERCRWRNPRLKTVHRFFPSRFVFGPSSPCGPSGWGTVSGVPNPGYAQSVPDEGLAEGASNPWCHRRLGASPLLVSRSPRLLRPGSVSDPRPLSRWQVLLLGVAPGSAIRSRDAPLRVGIPVASFGSLSRLVSYRPEGAVPAGQRAGPVPPAPPPVPACSSIFLACEVLGPPATAHAARRQAPIGASSSSHLGLQLIPISASSSPPSQPPFPLAATPLIPSG